MRRDHGRDHIQSHFYPFHSGNRLEAVSLFLENRGGGGGECKTSKGHARTLSFLRCFPRIFEEKRDSSQSLLEMVLTTTWLQCIY